MSVSVCDFPSTLIASICMARESIRSLIFFVSRESAAAFSILSFISAAVSPTFIIEIIPNANAIIPNPRPKSPSAGMIDDCFSGFEIISSSIIFIFNWRHYD